MGERIIATFCLCDDVLKAIRHQESPQCQMNDAEVMTTAFVAALSCRGHHESARAVRKPHGDIPQRLSKSRLSRRLHRVKSIFVIFFDLLGDFQQRIYPSGFKPNCFAEGVRARYRFHSRRPMTSATIDGSSHEISLVSTTTQGAR